MSILISIQNLSKAYGTQQLFQNISLGLFENEKLGLIGPNGTGKSTLLKILMGKETPDEGTVVYKNGMRLAYLSQQDSFAEELTVEKALMKALTKQNLDETEKHIKVNKFINLLSFENPLQKVTELSGGWRKRLAISCCLIQDPDLLLMDEPTNHLDIEGVLWLEKILQTATFAFVIITHDRYFLEQTTNRIIELSPRYQAGFLKTEGNYSSFLEQREAYLSEQDKKEMTLSNKVRYETEWLRTGPKARRTKAKFRINDAYQLQDELVALKQRNQADRSVYFDFDANDKKSKTLLKTHHISKRFGDKLLIEKLSLKLSPGMKIGLVGKNGSGKSTLMKLLAGKLLPDEGTIKPGFEVKIVDFEQDRNELNPADSVKAALSLNGSDTVIFRDKPVHIITWAKKLLFKPEQLAAPVSSLSGGEQARILIGRLMLQPADILLLDEPTNDLDIPSLEILEKTLLEFPGALVLVTHDRYLLDRITNQIISMDGKGGLACFADIHQCLNAWQQSNEGLLSGGDNQEKTIRQKTNQPDKKKLSNKEKYELDHIEETIQKAEHALNHIKEQIQDPKNIANPQQMKTLCEQMHEWQNTIETLYARWDDLESRK